MADLGYGNTGAYGTLNYKGEPPKIKAVNFLIEQYKKSYINSSTSNMVKVVKESKPLKIITLGGVSALGLIEQYEKGYING